VKHFDDIAEDQFDFHAYCLRKVTLRSYVEVLRFEDKVYGDDYFRRAAAGITRIYLHLFDNPIVQEEDEPDYSKMTAAERKKAKAVARKKKKTAEKKQAAEQEENGNAKGGKAAVADPDPFGKELLKKDPLPEAVKYTGMLVQYAPNSIETWILRYDVAMRRKKVLMALQALHKARRIDPTNPEVFLRIVAFAGKLDDLVGDSSSGPAGTVLREETPTLLNGKSSVAEFAKDMAAAVRDDPSTALPVRVAAAKALVETKSAPIPDACSLITDGRLDSMRMATVETCRDALTALKSFGSDAGAATNAWIGAVKQRFPLLSDFS